MSVTESQIIGGGEFEFGLDLESIIAMTNKRSRMEDLLSQPRPCGCPRDTEACPNPKELVSGSIFENMPCDVLLGKLALQEKRIAGNADASDGLHI